MVARTWGSGVSLSHGATAKPHLGDGGRALKALGHVALPVDHRRARSGQSDHSDAGILGSWLWSMFLSFWFMIFDSEFQGLGLRVEGLGFRVQGLGFRV